ncbi:hypothetical protein BC829DRAFT_415671 [Chytridium lagenaria]|nr:hypothetical protein BC829DRAFT_415671 [Chytridium lagenaria]
MHRRQTRRRGTPQRRWGWDGAAAVNEGGGGGGFNGDVGGVTRGRSFFAVERWLEISRESLYRLCDVLDGRCATLEVLQGLLLMGLVVIVKGGETVERLRLGCWGEDGVTLSSSDTGWGGGDGRCWVVVGWGEETGDRGCRWFLSESVFKARVKDVAFGFVFVTRPCGVNVFIGGREEGGRFPAIRMAAILVSIMAFDGPIWGGEIHVVVFVVVGEEVKGVEVEGSPGDALEEEEEDTGPLEPDSFKEGMTFTKVGSTKEETDATMLRS